MAVCPLPDPLIHYIRCKGFSLKLTAKDANKPPENKEVAIKSQAAGAHKTAINRLF
jgi:hypothetical protein